MRALTILSSGTPLSAVRASIWKALKMRRSPARMARGTPYLTCTASTPLLVSSPSIMSSWMRLATWPNSAPAAAKTSFSGSPPENSTARRKSTGLTSLPPASMRCLAASKSKESASESTSNMAFLTISLKRMAFS